jgi:hypothetical protein
VIEASCENALLEKEERAEIACFVPTPCCWTENL